MIDTPQIDVEPHLIDFGSQETYNEGVAAMNGDELDDLASTAVSGYKPIMEQTADGAVRFANTDGADENIQAWCHQAEQNHKHLNKDTYTRAASLAAASIIYDPQYADADAGTLKKLISSRIGIYGLGGMLFKDEQDPDAAAAAFQDGIINSAINSRAGNLKSICQNAISNYTAEDAMKDPYLRGMAQMKLDKLTELAPVKQDDPNTLEDDMQREEIKTRYDRWERAISDEIMLRAQDDLAAYLIDHPTATDAQKYAVIRNSAKRNYESVRDTVQKQPDYLGQFADARDKATAARAARYAKQGKDADNLLSPYKQAGEFKGRVDATEKAKQRVREGEVNKLAKDAEKAQFYAENPDLKKTAATPKRVSGTRTAAETNYASGKSIGMNVGMCHAMSDQPPTLVLPRAEFAKLQQQMNMQDGEGALVTIGTGKNATSYAVAPGDVSMPSMNHSMFQSVYFTKRSKLTQQDIELRASGYRQNLHFHKTRSKKSK